MLTCAAATCSADSVALQAAVDSCPGSCTVVLRQTYHLDRAVFLRPGVSIHASGWSLLVALKWQIGNPVDGGSCMLPIR